MSSDGFSRASLSNRSILRLGMIGAVCAGLAACQTSGADGVLGSVAKNEEQTGGVEVATAAPATPGRNPNARTRLINTRNSLTDFCPVIKIRTGTETYRIFPKGADEEDLDKLRYQATITKAARECKYVGNDLQMRVGLRGRVINGPSGETGKFQIPIRVAVVEGDQTIYSQLYKHDASIQPGKPNDQFSFVDENVVIPAPKATNIQIFIGFDPGPYNTP